MTRGGADTAMKFKGINSKSPGNLSELGEQRGRQPAKQMSPQNIFGLHSDNLDQDIDLIDGQGDSTMDKKKMRGPTFGNPKRISGFSQLQRKNTLFPREERTEAINIDESESDEDLDQYEVNMEQSGRKKKYKRIYDSKYKFPIDKKHHPLAKRTQN